jgi:hypothetical protein
VPFNINKGGHMKKLKLKGNETALEQEVINIINKNTEGYGCEDVKNYINDLLQSGCASGIVSELIYYKETTAFYNRHKGEIWDLVLDMAEESGYKNPFEFLATLNGSQDIGGGDQFENLLAWFAFEETARKLVEKNNINQKRRHGMVQICDSYGPQH